MRQAAILVHGVVNVPDMDGILPEAVPQQHNIAIDVEDGLHDKPDGISYWRSATA
jgi:hypothetical protein